VSDTGSCAGQVGHKLFGEMRVICQNVKSRTPTDENPAVHDGTVGFWHGGQKPAGAVAGRHLDRSEVEAKFEGKFREMAMTYGLPASHVRLKRVYEPAAPEDGMRILIDRLWPRGLRKADAAIDRWMKDIAPSTELRRWFGHDPVRWPAFHRRYIEELQQQAAAVDELRELARGGPVTLVFAAHDETQNNATALREALLHPQNSKDSAQVSTIGTAHVRQNVSAHHS
jgi:uncharacterized protein YeaO (DUF488 family)